MKTILSFLFCFFLWSNPLVVFCQNKIIFQVQSSPAKDSADTIFATGDFNNWIPNDLNYQFKNTNGIKSLEIILPNGNYEYKFTRGNWDKGETNMKGQPVKNRILKLSSDTAIDVVIQGWNDNFNPPTSKIIKHTASKNVTIIDTAFFIPQLNRTRRIWIYLPENYDKSTRKYPVLYMHDGQNLFDNATSYSGEWGVDEYLDSIFLKGKKQVIVVGIDNGLSKRMSEYNPWEFQNFGKGEGDFYVDFLVKTLKPFIDKNYKTLTSKKNTFIAGSSMGGLISLVAVLKYPNVFGGAGIFSPAFWTASGMDSLVTANAKNLHAKLFFYAGGKEGESMVPDMERVEKIIRSTSKSSSKELIDPNASHNEAAWRKYFPAFYEWTIAQ
jgi:predicted alpha/beta superfamily hydrolase